MSELDVMMKDLHRLLETKDEKERQRFTRKWASKMDMLAKALDVMKKEKQIGGC